MAIIDITIPCKVRVGNNEDGQPLIILLPLEIEDANILRPFVDSDLAVTIKGLSMKMGPPPSEKMVEIKDVPDANPKKKAKKRKRKKQ